MQILDSFGFEPIFFVAQIINFLILALIFKKFLYKPILKLLKDREKNIVRGLQESEMARTALDEATIKKDSIIRVAALEAEKIIEETKKNAENLREELLKSSKQEAEKLIKEAKDAADIEFQKAKDAAEEVSLTLAKKILDKVLSELFTKQEKEKILQRDIEKL